MTERKMLTIGCKLPSGLLMELGQPGDEGYRAIHLRGANHGEYTGRAETGKIFIPKTEHGFGLTQVNSEFWEAWRKKYPTNSARWLREGVLFVATTSDEARGEAADKADVKTGYEGINPDKLPQGLETRAAVS